MLPPVVVSTLPARSVQSGLRIQSAPANNKSNNGTIRISRNLFRNQSAINNRTSYLDYRENLSNGHSKKNAKSLNSSSRTIHEPPTRIFPKHKELVLAELFHSKLGAHMVSSKAGDFQEEHERELQLAVDEAEERATRELRAALKRLSHDKEEEKSKALRNQKEVQHKLGRAATGYDVSHEHLDFERQYYEKLSRRVEEQRNRAEAERERELTKKHLREKEEALHQQWHACEKIKEEAIAVACEELSRKLRYEFVLEKEKAVAEALRIAKEKYLIREKNTIEKTRRECAEEARKEAERVRKLHEQEIDRLNQRYDLLERKWLREVNHRKNVEQDFRELQDDYRRFMDYTDGMFHSDYLMQLRHMGQKLAEKQLSIVTYDDIEKEYDQT